MHRWAELDGALAGPGGPPGGAVAVLVGGELAHVGVAGRLRVGSPEPVRPDTAFRLMSMTKAVTAVATLALSERGALDPDDPVEAYLPAVGRMQVAGRPAAGPVRVRHLLTHTSGLLRGTGAHPVERAYAAAGVLAGQRGDHSLAEFCDRLATTELAFDPGTRFGYGFSTDVLGRVLEVVAGAPLDEVLDHLVLGPLGLADTGFAAPGGDAGRVAALHLATGAGVVALDGEWPVPVRRPAMLSGGAGLLSTVGDYARFVAMLTGGGTVDGVRVLTPGTVRRMTANALPGAGTIEACSGNGPAGGTGDPPGTYAGVGHGLGVAVVQDPAATAAPTRPGEYGWSGAAGSVFSVDPAGGTAVVVLGTLFGAGAAARRARLRVLAHRSAR